MGKLTLYGCGNYTPYFTLNIKSEDNRVLLKLNKALVQTIFRTNVEPGRITIDYIQSNVYSMPQPEQNKPKKVDTKIIFEDIARFDGLSLLWRYCDLTIFM